MNTKCEPTAKQDHGNTLENNRTRRFTFDGDSPPADTLFGDSEASISEEHHTATETPEKDQNGEPVTDPEAECAPEPDVDSRSIPDPDADVVFDHNGDVTTPKPPQVVATPLTLKRMMDPDFWWWELWVPKNKLCGLCGEKGVGKTVMLLDLIRRIYLGLPMPDGTDSPFPEGSRTLWVCSDGQQDEIVLILEEMGLPLDCLMFNAWEEEPLEGETITEKVDLERMVTIIRQEKPVLVIVDSLMGASPGFSLNNAEETTDLFRPLKRMAQKERVTIFFNMHTNRAGEVTGNQVNAFVRVIWQLECLNKERPWELILWVSKAFRRRPPKLKVTITDEGNEYQPMLDEDPFVKPHRIRESMGGPKPAARNSITALILHTLGAANDQSLLRAELLTLLKKSDPTITERTYGRALTTLEEAGKITSGKVGREKQLRLDPPLTGEQIDEYLFELLQGTSEEVPLSGEPQNE